MSIPVVCRPPQTCVNASPGRRRGAGPVPEWRGAVSLRVHAVGFPRRSECLELTARSHNLLIASHNHHLDATSVTDCSAAARQPDPYKGAQEGTSGTHRPATRARPTRVAPGVEGGRNAGGPTQWSGTQSARPTLDPCAPPPRPAASGHGAIGGRVVREKGSGGRSRRPLQGALTCTNPPAYSTG